MRNRYIWRIMIAFLVIMVVCWKLGGQFSRLMTPQVTVERSRGNRGNLEVEVPVYTLREADGQPVVFYLRERESALGRINYVLMMPVTVLTQNEQWVTVLLASFPSGSHLVALSSRPLYDGQRVQVMS